MEKSKNPASSIEHLHEAYQSFIIITLLHELSHVLIQAFSSTTTPRNINALKDTSREVEPVLSARYDLAQSNGMLMSTLVHPDQKGDSSGFWVERKIFGRDRKSVV